MSYGLFSSARDIRKDWDTICENSDKFCPKNEKHNAIMIGIYNRFAPSALLGCGISFLINWFNENDERYRVYFFRNKREFFNVINCPTATSIWIFSHGWRGGIRATDGNCFYSELIKKMNSDALNKDAIYQFHCNPGNDPSLVELLSVKRGFVNHRFNKPEQISEIIKILIEGNRLKDLIILN